MNHAAAKTIYDGLPEAAREALCLAAIRLGSNFLAQGRLASDDIEGLCDLEHEADELFALFEKTTADVLGHSIGATS